MVSRTSWTTTAIKLTVAHCQVNEVQGIPHAHGNAQNAEDHDGRSRSPRQNERSSLSSGCGSFSHKTKSRRERIQTVESTMSPGTCGLLEMWFHFTHVATVRGWRLQEFAKGWRFILRDATFSKGPVRMEDWALGEPSSE